MWESNPRYTSTQRHDAGEINLIREKAEENG